MPAPRIVATCIALALLAGMACRAPRQHGTIDGINDPFRDTDVEKWLDRFEVESREVYQHRREIVEAIGLRPGMDVADIGAGTGFFTLLFADAVKPGGTAYAVEINTGFLDMIRERAMEADVSNIETVLCTQDSTSLPPASIDVAFICDTYHHFEHPESTIRSIHDALRPGGRVVVIDFKHDYPKMPEERREWVAGHVRAGRAATIREIESEGFTFLNSPDPPYLTENYMIRFEKAR